jgi:glycosyltransferase involved in cell wall biosynthesis
LIVGIDASNLLLGGGRTHLIELLENSDPESFGISQIVLWGSESTLSLVNEKNWLKKIIHPALEKGLLSRLKWQFLALKKQAKEQNCDLLFVPGGTYLGTFHPFVTMSRNLLPFEWNELKRFGWSKSTIKLILLHLAQKYTFRKTDGLIFLSNYAKNTVEKTIGDISGKKIIIPHGIGKRFFIKPRTQKPIQQYSNENPIRILYVSIINVYKHQWNVIEAIANLRNETGWPILLELVGPHQNKSLTRLHKSIKKFDPVGKWIVYHGHKPFNELHNIYANADIGLFASSCENMPNILLETMAAGLPVASSNRGPMPEILGESGVYFDPENILEIKSVLQSLISSHEERFILSNSSFLLAQKYTWEICSNNTFTFLSEIYNRKKMSNFNGVKNSE